jgi:hypothetical protein
VDSARFDRTNLASLWEAVRLAHPEIKLTGDGNHPTVAGTYLYALAVYRQLTEGQVTKVSYVPEGLDPKEARELRQAVDSYPLLVS